ncbi:MAG: extracellular solute-binding protein [Candidatus Zambryskibacteria bacterium]|nr:extracellular solute-binding protein [Candidatus Zambryskibacteria bacterium]
MSKFQLILTGLFAAFIVIGVIIFAAFKGGSVVATEVVIWGTIPKYTFDNIIESTSLYNNDEYNVQYIEKSEEDFDNDFIEALASDSGPDVFLLPSSKILKHRNKIFPVPYEVYNQRQFKNTFIEGTEIYMAPEGILALPVIVDPLVMYWNRQIFNKVKITEPPKYWDEFYNLANLISQKDGALNILQSLVAFGEFENISHAKEIILNLAMQAGTPVTIWNEGNAKSVFSDSFNKIPIPAEAAVNFYTEFSNPVKPTYSWNRSLPSSFDYFLSGNLALYLGFASEISNIQLKNPNLNFDVTSVPVSREGNNDTSFAEFQAFAITKSSKNRSAAFGIISILTSNSAVKAFSENLKLAPARRDLLSFKPIDAYQSVFYDSAIRARTWLDPSPKDTNVIFKDMIESITSGRSRTSEAVVRTHRELSSLLQK